MTPNEILGSEFKANLKADYPNQKLHGVSVGKTTFVIRKPSHIEWERYEQDKGDSSEAARMLVKTCVVYPSEADFDAIMADKYVIYQPLGDFIGKLVGLERVEELESF